MFKTLRAIALGAVVALVSVACSAQTLTNFNALPADVRMSVQAFMADELAVAREANGFDATLNAHLVDLNNDGTPEVIVVVEHPFVCGTGGCLTYVFEVSSGTATPIVEVLSRGNIALGNGTTGDWRNLVIDGSSFLFDTEKGLYVVCP
jgi:hypothetical protein